MASPSTAEGGANAAGSLLAIIALVSMALPCLAATVASGPGVSGVSGVPARASAGTSAKACAPSGSAGHAANPPCGYIRPTLRLTFPDVPSCPIGPKPEELARCAAVLRDGESVVLHGTVLWTWDMARDGTYPTDPNTPIVISFPAARNVPWLSGVVDPPSYTIDFATINDPRYVQPNPDPNGFQLNFVYEKPVNLTLTRHGSPDGLGRATIVDDGGVVQFAVKAQSNPSGSYFTASFGLTALGFRYEDELPTTTHGAPAPGGMALLSVLALVLIAQRCKLARKL